VRRIYKYVHGINHWGLCYQSGIGVNLFETYVDANFVIDFIDRKIKNMFCVENEWKANILGELKIK
jgi:hypothetical protein